MISGAIIWLSVQTKRWMFHVQRLVVRRNYQLLPFLFRPHSGISQGASSLSECFCHRPASQLGHAIFSLVVRLMYKLLPLLLLEYEVIWGHIDILVVVVVRRLSRRWKVKTLLAGPSPTSPMKAEITISPISNISFVQSRAFLKALAPCWRESGFSVIDHPLSWVMRYAAEFVGSLDGAGWVACIYREVALPPW